MLIKDRAIKFEITNFGRTPALIREIWAKLVIASLPPRPPFDFNIPTYWSCHTPLSSSTPPVEYSFGVAESFKTAPTNFKDGNWEMITDIPSGQTVYFMVEVVYYDPQGTGHVTADCWEYTDPNTIFFRVDDPDSHSMT